MHFFEFLDHGFKIGATLIAADHQCPQNRHNARVGQRQGSQQSDDSFFRGTITGKVK
jgi:hypothetical protein